MNDFPIACQTITWGDEQSTFLPGVFDDGNPPGSSVRTSDMAEAIQEGRRPEVTGEDGRIALQVSLAALQSIETGEIAYL